MARSAFARVGDDERVWFKGNPDAYSDDDVASPGTFIHWNAAGQIEKANQLKSVLGY